MAPVTAKVILIRFLHTGLLCNHSLAGCGASAYKGIVHHFAGNCGQDVVAFVCCTKLKLEGLGSSAVKAEEPLCCIVTDIKIIVSVLGSNGSCIQPVVPDLPT